MGSRDCNNPSRDISAGYLVYVCADGQRSSNVCNSKGILSGMREYAVAIIAIKPTIRMVSHAQDFKLFKCNTSITRLV